MARVLRTPPPDLTHIWMRNGGRFSLERVQKIIAGETQVGTHGTSEMPLWGAHLFARYLGSGSGEDTDLQSCQVSREDSIQSKGVTMHTKNAFGVLTGALILICSSAAQNQKAPPPATADKTRLIASIQGPALYKAYCAVCHGTEGRGDGPMAKSLRIPVADLTRIAARNGGRFPRKQMEQIILGQEMPAGHGAREMPLWGSIFSQVSADQELGRVRVDNLARFLEGLQVK